MKKLNKIIKLTLLLITNNIISMEEPENWQEQEQKGILSLPTEVLEQIVCPNLIKEIDIMHKRIDLGEIKDIFDFYKYFNINVLDALFSTKLACKGFSAIILNNVRRLKDLFEEFKDSAIEDYEGLSTEELNQMLKKELNSAPFITDLKTCYRLILAGANVNIQDKNGETTLIEAIKTGNSPIVKLLLSNGANLNLQDQDGDTALMTAINYNRTEIAKLILQSKNIDINISDKNGDTALTLAAGSGNIDIVTLLLQNPNININAQNKHGFTALIAAVRWGTIDPKILELLLNSNANTDIQDKRGNTALITATELKHTREVKLLLEHNANVNIQNKNGEAVLDIAKENNSRKIIKLIEDKLKI